ncbi:MAG: NUDIX domain-containing protein [Vicinamibacteria bacterium]|jgi:8-oxo-dGTP pyrophosphatase MutT (NUDIX family)|nr:NUDIX domain-containing protein [Vicinamibacteria bacterium]
MAGNEHEELLNAYDDAGRVIGAERRGAAVAEGHAIGAVNVLILNTSGEVLLQLRPRDKENGGLWDKSVGGHVSAGEDFDATAQRECGEELFSDAQTPALAWCDSFVALGDFTPAELAERVVLWRAGLQLDLRDVRRAPDGGVRNVRYHVGLYLGRTALRSEDFFPPADEIGALRYFRMGDVDRLFLDGALAPNMGFLWLTQGHRLGALARRVLGA